MSKLSLRLSLLTAFDIKKDPVIESYINLASEEKETAFAAYTTICASLLKDNKTLSDYLHDLLLFSDAPMVRSYIQDGSKTQSDLIAFDVGIIKELAAVDSVTVKNVLKNKFKDDYASSMPDYELGSFEYTTDYFINTIKRNGDGIFAKYKAFSMSYGILTPIERYDFTQLRELKKYEAQRSQIVDNTICFLAGQKASNILLYGDIGTGKSSTVKALLNEYDELRIIQADMNSFDELQDLYRTLSEQPLKFIIYFDDISFSAKDGYGGLKHALEGSLEAKPDNVIVYAVFNHIDEKGAFSDETNAAESETDNLKGLQFLKSRFGISVNFPLPNKELYLEIVTQLAEERNIDADKIVLVAGAEKFSIKRGGRSPEIAKQYIDMVESRVAMGLSLL